MRNDDDNKQIIRAGRDIRTLTVGDQTVISGRPNLYKKLSSWKLTFGGGVFSVGYGVVNQKQPTINGITISGDNAKDKTQPIVKIVGYDGEGRTWVALQVTTDPATGKIAKASKSLIDPITVISTNLSTDDQLVSPNPNTWLWPLAIITEKGTVHKCCDYDLNFVLGYPLVPIAGGVGGSNTPFGFFY